MWFVAAALVIGYVIFLWVRPTPVRAPQSRMTGEVTTTPSVGDLWTYRAADLGAYDGDTITTLADLGFSVRTEQNLRLRDVHAPELRETCGVEARDFVRAWLRDVPPTDRRWPLLLQTEPNSLPEPEERRSFTRYVAEVWTIDGARHLNADVIAWLAARPECGPGS